MPLSGDQRWFASYTRVSYLAYRTPAPAETYDVFGVGLGRGFSDYDEIKIGADLAVVRRTPLRLYVAHRRQGEGDYRDGYPLPADYATTPAFLGGVVMGVTRVALSGASRWRDLEIGGDLASITRPTIRTIGGATPHRFRGQSEGYDRAPVEISFNVVVDSFCFTGPLAQSVRAADS